MESSQSVHSIYCLVLAIVLCSTFSGHFWKKVAKFDVFHFLNNCWVLISLPFLLNSFKQLIGLERSPWFLATSFYLKFPVKFCLNKKSDQKHFDKHHHIDFEIVVEFYDEVSNISFQQFYNTATSAAPLKQSPNAPHVNISKFSIKVSLIRIQYILYIIYCIFFMPSFQFMDEGPTSYITGLSSVVLYLAHIIYHI